LSQLNLEKTLGDEQGVYLDSKTECDTRPTSQGRDANGHEPSLSALLRCHRQTGTSRMLSIGEVRVDETRVKPT
jgi:hypothetical protein